MLQVIRARSNATSFHPFNRAETAAMGRRGFLKMAGAGGLVLAFSLHPGWLLRPRPVRAGDIERLYRGRA